MPNLCEKHVAERSPLKGPPLRTPGQPVQEEIDRTFEQTLELSILIIFVAFLAAHEWMRLFFDIHPQPIRFSVIAIIVFVYCGTKMVSTIRKMRRLKQVGDGEKVLGPSLETLRERGYRVLDGIVGNGFNIDHMLVGPTGIYTIETKTISKPARGSRTIVYDGEKISVDGFMPDRDPIIQAKAQAGRIRDFLKEEIAREIPVRPVVLYPGWFVKAPRNGCGVWVLNPDHLPGFLQNEMTSLDARDIQAIEGCLSAHIGKRDYPEVV